MSWQLKYVAAVVPVNNPEPGLVRLCERLIASFGRVIVVDDGSTENVSAFGELPEGVCVLTHPINRGKGRAIKTAMAHLAQDDHCQAVVFADGDGQHRIEDIEKVALKALETQRITFGVRDFSSRGVPFRSWWGNRWTSLEVFLAYGLRISDTQTGLRAVPRRFWLHFIALRGERFEFEARIFRFLSRIEAGIEQVPIETIYIASNRKSHFRPFVDTLLTQWALFS